MGDEPTPELCSLCGITRRFRRTLCRSCYRKLRRCGCPLPPRGRSGGRRPVPRRWTAGAAEKVLETRLYRWLLRWPAEARVKLEAALARVKEGAP